MCSIIVAVFIIAIIGLWPPFFAFAVANIGWVALIIVIVILIEDNIPSTTKSTPCAGCNDTRESILLGGLCQSCQ